MKKLIKLASAMCILFAITNCNKQKNEAQPTTISNNNELIESLKIETDKYTGNQSLTNLVADQNISAKPNWKKIKKIIKADALGALAGGASGATIGANIGAIGAVAGGIGGGIIGGVASSIAPYVVPNPTTTPTGGVLPNPNNAFEQVGVKHNELSFYVLSNKAIFYVNDNLDIPSFYTYASNELIKGQYFKTPQDVAQIYSVAQNMSDVQYIINNLDDNYLQFTNTYFQQNRINQIERQIYNLYFTGLEFTTNYAEFQVFSIIFENIIINSNLDATSKVKLLVTMATVRYSSAFWEQQS
jgi:hypothetical protein